MTDDPTAPVAPRPAHARLIARTDGAGALTAFEADDGAEAEAELAISLDLVAAALARFGEARALGRFRTALLMFEGATLAIGRDEAGGSIVVRGDAEATPGLVLSQLNRVVASAAGPGGEP